MPSWLKLQDFITDSTLSEMRKNKITLNETITYMDVLKRIDANDIV